MTRTLRAATLLAALALGACAPRVPPPDLSLEPGPLLAQVEGAAAQVQRVQGEARLRVGGQGVRGAITAFVAAEKPDRLRVESVDFFGNPAAVLVAAGGRLAIYDARERTFFRGAATPQNLALLVPLPLTPAELVAILCGAPLLAGEAVSAEPGRGYVTLELRAGPRTQRLRIGAGAAVLWAAASGDLVTPDHQVRFEEFRDDLVVARFPTALSLWSEAPKVELELTWIEGVEPNAALDPAVFRLDPPAGARIVELDKGAPASPPPLVPVPPHRTP
jgi:outer membrane lipoprotein-sorting protein